MEENGKKLLTQSGYDKLQSELENLKVNARREIADKIIRNDLSVRATEKLAEKVKDELRPERKRRRNPSDSERKQAKSDDVLAVERELMTLTGTKVNISGDSRGKLELEFYSIEELNRLIDIIREAFR